MYVLGNITQENEEEANAVLKALLQGKNCVSVNGVTICDATEIKVEERTSYDECGGLLEIVQKDGETSSIAPFDSLIADTTYEKDAKILSIYLDDEALARLDDDAKNFKDTIEESTPQP